MMMELCKKKEAECDGSGDMKMRHGCEVSDSEGENGENRVLPPARLHSISGE